VSTEALAWGMSYAPDVPKHLVSTLLAYCNYADDKGNSAAPTLDVVAWHTRKDRRSARNDVRALEATGLIRKGNQDIVLYLPADRRPVVYDLAMERTRGPRPEPAPSGKPAVDNDDREEAHFPPVGDTGGKPTSPRSGTGGKPTSPRSGTGGKPTSPRSDREETHFPPVDQGKLPESDTGGKPTSSIKEVVGEVTTPPTTATPGLTAEESALHAELMAARPAWSPSVLAQVLADPAIRGRPDRALVRLAFLDAAATRGTFSPRRLLADGCPSWVRAERERFGDEDTGEGRTAEPAAVLPRTVPWCGSDGCDRTTRVLVDPRTQAPLPGFSPCPDCHPYPQGRPPRK
jgi:hypothetical protein